MIEKTEYLDYYWDFFFKRHNQDFIRKLEGKAISLRAVDTFLQRVGGEIRNYTLEGEEIVYELLKKRFPTLKVMKDYNEGEFDETCECDMCGNKEKAVEEAGTA